MATKMTEIPSTTLKTKGYQTSTTARTVGQAPQTTRRVELPSEAIAKRAYQLFERRGRVHGHDREDWVQAEKELRTELK